MSLRSTLATVLAATTLAACAGLYFWNPSLVPYALGFALMGAIAARLFPFNSRREQATPTADATTTPSVTRASIQQVTLTSDELSAGALLEHTLESMRAGVLITDAAMRVTYLNRAARSLFGLGEDQPPARRLSEMTRNPIINSAFTSALERGERTEVKVELQAGERRSFDLHVAPLRSKARGGTRGAVGIFFDITRLERLERVRQEFLSNVSHELRTPLTAILTFVETLEEGAIDDPAHNRRFLSIIRRNTERMRSLIDDILELSAIEAGTVTVEVGPMRLQPLVAEVITNLAARATERNVTLCNNVVADAVVLADARRLEQMLSNLVDNAIKFNREGGSVTVAHERDTRDRIIITDTGEGIAPEHIARIFERFYRVDRARSRALGGTGLGLAIVKHLARAQGGEARVCSTLGQGSTFIIELPAPPEA